MKNLFILISFMIILLSKNAFGSNEYLNNYYSKIAKRAELIVEAKVTGIVTVKDAYGTNNQLVDIEIVDVIKGYINEKNSKLRYPIDIDLNGVWKDPQFKDGEVFIAVLFKDTEGYWIPIGGSYGKFAISNGKVGKKEITKDKFKKDFKDLIQGKIKFMDFFHDDDLDSGQSYPSKLDGEFFITAQGKYPPSTIVEFKLNPDGALDKDGNQLSFSAVRSALQRAFDTWNSVNHSYATFTISSTQYNGTRNSSDNISTITFEAYWAAGVAYRVDAGNFYTFDLVLSKGYGYQSLRWNTNSTYPSSYSTYSNPYASLPWGGGISQIGPVDLEEIAAHELGHIVGLQHASDHSTYTMNPTDYTVNNWWESISKRSLELGDKAGKIYQAPDFSSTSTQSIDKLLLSNKYSTTFQASFTVPSGRLLEVETGKNIQFASGTSLTVNGVLNANGVTFTSTSGTSANSWGNIVLYGSGASGSVITNSNILYGGGVQVINVPDFEISNSTFTNNYLSVYVSGSAGLIEDNTLTSNSSGHSIQALNSSTLDCIGNNITKTSTGQGQGAGIEYGGGTSGIISENNISYCSRGISIHWGSSASSTSTYPAKNNRVRNCGAGIMIYSSSYGTFGTSTAGNQYARNSIYSNTSNASIGTLYTTYASGLYGYYNWWGDNPPNTALFSVGPNAYFYYNPYLTTDPWAGFAKVNGIASTADSDINQINTPTENKGSLLEGIELRLNKKYKESMDFFILYIKEYPSDQQAYVELYNCRSKETTPELINIFNSLPKEATKDHKLLLSYLYLNEGNIEEAKRVNELIISENPNTSLAAKAGVNNIYISLYNENKIETAVSAFSSILNTKGFETIKEFEDVEYALQSYARINNKTVPNFSISKNSEEQNTAATNTVDEFNLVGNYPNPFNPTTLINYSLPVNANVKIIIYDIMGRLIKSFDFNSQSSGYHKVEWNGTNSSGLKVSSGIYIYRMEAVSLEGNAERFVQSKKMILLK